MTAPEIMKKRKFICLTGIDGTGKTTQARGVSERCRKEGLRAGYVWARWEPFFLRPVTALYFRRMGLRERGGQDYKKAIHAKTRLLRHPAIRKIWHIISLLDYWITKRPRVFLAGLKWDIFICDRYVYDYAVDQALNLGISPKEMVQDLGNRIFRYFPKPDLTIVLLLPAEEGSRRKQDGTGFGYLNVRAPYYRALLDCDGVVGVDASGSVEKVQGVVWNHVKSHLPKE
jgi:dTMP kinase